jgi:hypothetical protein
MAKAAVIMMLVVIGVIAALCLIGIVTGEA